MQKQAVPRKNIPGRSNDGKNYSYADENSGGVDRGRVQSTSFKSFGMQRKDNKDFLFDMKEQLVLSI